MNSFFLFTLIFLLLCTNSYAFELNEPQTDTVEDLLLFYDWNDLLVEAPTRRPTKLKHVAENISIITAGEIATMNAHSVNEILLTITGMDIDFNGGHFGGHASLGIQGSFYEHVLLLLDGVRLNDVDAGWPETTGIPIQIIDRIEIIKGPASSAWGSALGGVINIVTKETGRDHRPTGTLYGSYGDGPSQDYRADAAGSLGKLRYYLFGGYMDSDGLVDDRYFKNKSFYGKLISELTRDVSLTFTAGYWYPDYKEFDLPEMDRNYKGEIENHIVTGKLDADLFPGLSFNLDMYLYSQKWQNHLETLDSGESINDQIWDNDYWGGNANLIWEKNRHTMLFGADFSRGDNDRTWLYASAPTISADTETRKDWALYFNDTIKRGKLTVTPGVRYDHLSITGASSDDLVNPSLGATYSITDKTLLRTTAARGFIRPGIGLTVGNPVGYAGYPDLKPEDIWSFQVGVESIHFTNTHLKADVFYHNVDDTWYWSDDLSLWINGGVSERTGFELNAAASPFENFTGSLGLTYIWIEPYQEKGDDTYSINAKMNYKTQRTGSITLFGRYHWWNEHDVSPDASYDAMIWDLHYNKDIFTDKVSGSTLNIFFSGRNLFDGEHYSNSLLKNPGRWFEGGVRLNF